VVNDVNTPSVLAPWYVVYMEHPETAKLEYYRSINDQIGTPTFFSPVKGLALTFKNIRDAARVASALQPGACIRVLITAQDAKEFGHAG
jgi:hypothetical protein